jgi:isopenicillin-N N-acyltransferase-like protein
MGMQRSLWRAHRRKIEAALAIATAPLLAHGAIAWGTRVQPPRIELPPPSSSHSWTRVRGGLREIYLEGSPEEIGAAHARLVSGEMLEVERQLWGDFEHFVPLWIARVGIEDWSRVRYRHVDQGIPEPRRRELAAQSLLLTPDPFASRLPTYQRLVFLHALYDIALSLEHSPLIGCTTIAIAPAQTADGHVLAARAFDFEGGDVFDREKAVFFVRENGSIPFASVAWPGLVGVVTGMNAEGVFLAVQGARAGQPSTEGIPVTFAAREALAHAHDTPEAVAILSAQPVMISHIVFVADGEGRFAVVERAPGAAAYVRASTDSVAVTNHFEGPLAIDPKNLRIRETTSTLARRQRADELLQRIAPHSAGPEAALAILRDHGCADGLNTDETCALGDRRAIDALIATHGVVADLTARVLWVSAGPHLSGRFVRLDLRTLLAPSHVASADLEPETMPAEHLGAPSPTPAP